MSLLHMLFAIAFAFTFIWARMIVAPILWGFGRVLVVHVTITLFLRWPTEIMVLAVGLTALPRPRVGLFMFAALQISIGSTGIKRAYVKSHGRLKVFEQSRHFCTSLIGGGMFLRRRAIDLSASSSESSLAHLFRP